jgi:hypothetical protein
MEPSKALIDELRREEIEDARKLSISQKLALSGDLFDWACEVTLSGIRSQHPRISRTEALNILRERLDSSRQRETRL